MSEQRIHELALAYTQIRFQEDLKFQPQVPPEDRKQAVAEDDVLDFFHLYQFAYENIQESASKHDL